MCAHVEQAHAHNARYDLQSYKYYWNYGAFSPISPHLARKGQFLCKNFILAIPAEKELIRLKEVKYFDK